MLKEDVLAIVTKKVPDGIDLEGNVDEVEQAILNHCHIKSIPVDLKYIWARMAVDLARHELALAHEAKDDKVEVGGQITSIKAGDTTFGLSSSTEKTLWLNDRQSHKPDIDVIILNYVEQLSSFRCMRG